MASKEESLIQEAICKLYLRLNGYFTSGLILHGLKENRTFGELDIIAVRFPTHTQDEAEHNSSAILSVPDAIDVIIAEVKSQGQPLKFNRSLSTDGELTGWLHLLRWSGILKEDQLLDVARQLNSLVIPKMNEHSTEFPCVVSETAHGSVSFRPILFSPERVNLNNASLFITWTEINDFIWTCLCPEVGSRDSCSTRYDFQLWGSELSPIVKAYKSRQKSQVKFVTIKEVYSFAAS